MKRRSAEKGHRGRTGDRVGAPMGFKHTKRERDYVWECEMKKGESEEGHG